jgi:hypothetical protein
MPKKGDVVLLRVADNFDQLPGVQLESSGNGEVEAVSSGIALAELEEVVDFTGTDETDRLVRVRIL